MFEQKIEAMLRTFLKTETDEELLYFVVENAHEVLYMNQDKLCMEAGVEESRLLNFFRTFEVDKLVAFKYILRKCLYNDSTPDGPVRKTLPQLGEEVFRMEYHNLTSLASTLDYDLVEQLAADIWASPQVNIFSRGDTTALAQALERFFQILGIASERFTKRGISELDRLEELDPSGLVIVFTRRRYSVNLLMQIKLLKQRGFRIVCIADDLNAPLITTADYHFVLPSISFDFASSLSAGAAFLQILALCLGQMKEDVLYARLHKRDISIQENNMFW